MSSITNASYHTANEHIVEPKENNMMSDNFYNVRSYESTNLKQNSDNCLNIKSTCIFKNAPEIAVNDCENTLIFVDLCDNTLIDTEIQMVAKRFVESLLLQAQKEVNAKLAEKDQVLL
jgi:hypothetical protein